MVTYRNFYKVWLYERCHQKSLSETSNLIRKVEFIPEIQTEISDTGCFGMAGEFGYKFQKILEKIAYNSLGEYANRIREHDIVVATEFSCRNQLSDIFKIKSLHLLQLFLKYTKK